MQEIDIKKKFRLLLNSVDTLSSAISHIIIFYFYFL